MHSGVLKGSCCPWGGSRERLQGKPKPKTHLATCPSGSPEGVKYVLVTVTRVHVKYVQPPFMLPPPCRDPGLSLLSLLALTDGSLKEPARPGSVLNSFRVTWNKLLHCSEPQSPPVLAGAGL